MWIERRVNISFFYMMCAQHEKWAAEISIQVPSNTSQSARPRGCSVQAPSPDALHIWRTLSAPILPSFIQTSHCLKSKQKEVFFNAYEVTPFSNDVVITGALLCWNPIGLLSRSFSIPLWRWSKLCLWRTVSTLRQSGQHFILPPSLSLSHTLYLLSFTDISPPAQGVDHRHVQKELGEVIVRLHNPVVLSPTTIQVTWTVRAACLFANKAWISLTEPSRQ